MLKAYGPVTEGGVALGPLPDDLNELILRNSARYPLQWIVIAEASRSQLNTEPPLLAAAGTWFDDLSPVPAWAPTHSISSTIGILGGRPEALPFEIAPR